MNSLIYGIRDTPRANVIGLGEVNPDARLVVVVLGDAVLPLEVAVARRVGADHRGRFEQGHPELKD